MKAKMILKVRAWSNFKVKSKNSHPTNLLTRQKTLIFLDLAKITCLVTNGSSIWIWINLKEQQETCFKVLIFTTISQAKITYLILNFRASVEPIWWVVSNLKSNNNLNWFQVRWEKAKKGRSVGKIRWNWKGLIHSMELTDVVFFQTLAYIKLNM